MHPSLLSLSFSNTVPFFSPIKPAKFPFSFQSYYPNRPCRPSVRFRCSALSFVNDACLTHPKQLQKPSPAEVCRTIMELSTTGTISAIAPEGSPVGIGARFVIDTQGTPVLCLKDPGQLFNTSGPSSFHVQEQLELSRSRMRQCTLLGNLKKLDDRLQLKNLRPRWEKKFGEEMDEDLIYVITVDRVLQIEDFEEMVWITSMEYINAKPDPLRDFAVKILYEIEAKHAEDVKRLCSVYFETQFLVTDAKLAWLDRLGFDLYMYAEEGVFTARIPFPREVTDEKSVKSSFNSMFHLAWEVEKGYVPGIEKVSFLKKIR
ncbi:hypothetical protein HPP92_013427 [Vanilla planifolia]|uniref:DUF2470 domain-containing protein n=1 Tax=Vanilla planifolia TaxID=51239 RepID=A0A835QNF1_VANPL|nr:hypothetical protein HPP92_013427 [Vanilla planifolia]